MTNEELASVLNKIDDRFLERAEPRPRAVLWRRILRYIINAVIVLLIISAAVFALKYLAS